MIKNQIQLACECDLNEILKLQKCAFEEVAKKMKNYNLPPLLQTLEEIQIEFKSFIILKYTNKENQIIGSVRASLDGLKICHVGKLIVHPDYQNRGIGRKLMFEIERYFPKCKRFALFTGEETSNTLHLYRKVGYEITEKRIMNSIPMYIMEKKNHHAIHVVEN